MKVVRWVLVAATVAALAPAGWAHSGSHTVWGSGFVQWNGALTRLSIAATDSTDPALSGGLATLGQIAIPLDCVAVRQEAAGHALYASGHPDQATSVYIEIHDAEDGTDDLAGAYATVGTGPCGAGRAPAVPPGVQHGDYDFTSL